MKGARVRKEGELAQPRTELEKWAESLPEPTKAERWSDFKVRKELVKLWQKGTFYPQAMDIAEFQEAIHEVTDEAVVLEVKGSDA